MKKIGGFWKNPWTVSIGSGLVVLVMTVIIDMITAEKVFSTIKTIFSILVNAILAFLNFEIKVWWILIGIAALLLALWVWVKIRDSKVDTVTQFLEYNQDTVLGYTWKWVWEKNSFGKYSIEDLHPICQKCSTPLIYDYIGYGRAKCLRCGKVYTNDLPKVNEVKMLIYDNVRRKYFPNE